MTDFKELMNKFVDSYEKCIVITNESNGTLLAVASEIQSFKVEGRREEKNYIDVTVITTGGPLTITLSDACFENDLDECCDALSGILFTNLALIRLRIESDEFDARLEREYGALNRMMSTDDVYTPEPKAPPRKRGWFNTK